MFMVFIFERVNTLMLAAPPGSRGAVEVYQMAITILRSFSAQ
jgi:hypothetical protein